MQARSRYIVALLLLIGAGWLIVSSQKPSLDSPTPIPNSRFGTIQVYGAHNVQSTLILYFGDLDPRESSSASYLASLVKRGHPVAAINLPAYLTQVRTERGGERPACFETAGEISRLSQVLQNALTMDEVSKAIVIGAGAQGSLFAFQIQKYLKTELLASLALGLPIGADTQALPCRSENDEEARAQNFPLNVIENEGDRDTYENFRYLPSPSSARSLEPRISHAVGANFLTCTSATCPLLDQCAPVHSARVSELPIIEAFAKQPTKDFFVVFLSGDGGWATIDKELAKLLNHHGISVVGLNSLRYFWREKAPEVVSKDISSIIDRYRTALKKERVVLAGFSLGANAIPFILTRLPEKSRARIVYYSMLSPSKNTEFEVHLTDWLPSSSEDAGTPIAPEFDRMIEVPASCFYGTEDDSTLCRQPLPSWIKIFPLKGDHHFDSNYKEVAEILVKEIETRGRR